MDKLVSTFINGELTQAVFIGYVLLFFCLIGGLLILGTLQDSGAFGCTRLLSIALLVPIALLLVVAVQLITGPMINWYLSWMGLLQ